MFEQDMVDVLDRAQQQRSDAAGDRRDSGQDRFAGDRSRDAAALDRTASADDRRAASADRDDDVIRRNLAELPPVEDPD